MNAVIEKIKKLLRLARSSNPHEAQLALARAMALAQEHGVAIEGLNPDEQANARRVLHEDTEPLARLSYDQRYAWTICREFFNVDTVERRCLRVVDGWPRDAVKMAVVGTAADIAIARWVAKFITGHFAHCWRHHRGRLRNRQAYVHGMFIGLWARLAEERPAPLASHALVTRERDDYIARHIGATTSKPLGAPDHEASAAKWAGFLRGKDTAIRKPLGTPGESRLALTS